MFLDMFSVFKYFSIFFVIALIFAMVIIAGVWIYMLLCFLSPKFKGKMMARRIRSTKHMMDAAADDLKDIGAAGVEISRSVIIDNKQPLKETADAGAYILRDALRGTVGAATEGFSEKHALYCKYCGAEIDSDSKFCGMCGKALK